MKLCRVRPLLRMLLLYSLSFPTFQGLHSHAESCRHLNACVVMVCTALQSDSSGARSWHWQDLLGGHGWPPCSVHKPAWLDDAAPVMSYQCCFPYAWLYLLTAAWPYLVIQREGQRTMNVAESVAGEGADNVLRDVEAQYVAGLRRKDGRTVGLGL